MIVFVMTRRAPTETEMRIIKADTVEKALRDLNVYEADTYLVGSTTEFLYLKVEEGDWTTHVELKP